MTWTRNSKWEKDGEFKKKTAGMIGNDDEDNTIYDGIDDEE